MRHTKKAILLSVALFVASGAWFCVADTYTQRTQATLGEITSQTTATRPANRDRTTIGLGEEVTCSIDASTWSDKDCNTTQNRIEDDTIGTRQWSASGAGTVSPTAAGSYNSCTLTGHQSPGGVTVQVTVKDSETRYNDVVTKSKSFTVIAPNGMNAALQQDLTPGTAGPPNNNVGSASIFDCIVQPTTVNFYRAQFRENIPGDTWTWPDGTSGSRPAAIVAWTVQDHGADHNWTSDTLSEPLQPIARLDSPGAPVAYVNHSHNIRVPEEYMNQSDLWVGWLTGETHPREYRGTDLRARSILNASNTAQGGWMGPWQ